MKKWAVLLMVSTFVGVASAQKFDPPKDGAKIHLSSYEVELNQAEEATVDIWVVRSKRARKSTFDAPKFLGPDSLDIQITQDPADQNHFVATVNAKGVSIGSYFYTVTSRSRSTQKVKGTTISFTLINAPALTKNN